MKSSKIKQTPYPYHGNLLSKIQQQTEEGHPLTKTIETSDVVLSQFEGINEQLEQIVVRTMEIRVKELDQPLGFFKSIAASIANISKTHQFLIFQTDIFLISVDFYINNRLVIRIGDKPFVLETTKSQKRAQSVIKTQKNGLQWKFIFTKTGLTVGKLLNYLLLMKMKDFSQAFNNGSHLSQQIFLSFQNEYNKQQ